MAGLVGLSPHHFAYAFKQSVGLQNLLDLAKYTNRLSLGVTIGLRAAGLGLLADDRRHLAARDGGRLPLAIYFAAVVCPTSMPSLRSSP